MLDLSNMVFKTKEEIKKQAPSVFTTQRAHHLSEQYTHIPTDKVIDDMEMLGWKVVDAKEVKARTGIGFQKHLIVFRNPDIIITGDNGDDVFPQILLSNSHDGKNAFTFTAGIFRCICENGLVVSTEQFEDVKIRHIGYTFEELQNKIHAMVEKLPLTVDSMNKMKNIELLQEQAIEFAKKALEARFGTEQNDRIKVDYEALLSPVRNEDKGNSLWSVFNVVQEKILNGDFQYNYSTKTRKARKVKNFSQDISINKKLFDIALTYVN
jgi:hypothetical protein